MKLIHIDSGLFAGQSVTRKLTAEVVERFKQQHDDLEISYRDLTQDAPNHLTGEILMAGHQDPDSLSEAQRKELALTQTLLEEFMAADILVIGAPMYNFSIPTQLKAYIDRVLQAGKTFRYTESGPEGLSGGKKVVVVSARGGIYSVGAAAAADFQENYLRQVMRFVGIDDVTVIRAEGVNLGDAQKQTAVEAAVTLIDETLGELALA